MSSLNNQPVTDEIVSAFEITQNQPWSVFNSKLASVPIKDDKKKDIFKSENPIELSDEDIPVFGLVPRLEKLMLISCNKCSMVVKRDCIHHHYNRRHNNPENGDFSLERFILPTVKINKHKKQKISLRKLPGKKAIDYEDIDPVVQGIKTEFDQLEFERIAEMNNVTIKQENEMQYADECDVNLGMGSCNPSTSYGTWLKPCTQNLVHFVDKTINNNVECDVLNTFSPDNEDELVSNNLNIMNDTNIINYVTKSNQLLTKPKDLNKKAKSKIAIDFSSIMSDDEYDEVINKLKYEYNLPSELQSNKEQIKCSKNNIYSGNISNNCEKFNENTSQSSFTSGNVKEKITFTSNKDSDNMNTKYFNNDLTTIDQPLVTPVSVEEETQFKPSDKYLNVMNDKGNNINISACLSKLNEKSQSAYESINNKKQTLNSPTNLDEVNDNSSSNSVVSYCQSSNALVNIKNAYQSPIDNDDNEPTSSELLKIKKAYQSPIHDNDNEPTLSTELLNIKNAYRSPSESPINNDDDEPISSELLNIKIAYSNSSNALANIKNEYQSSIDNDDNEPTSSELLKIKKAYQSPVYVNDNEPTLPNELLNINNKYEPSTIPLNIEEEFNNLPEMEYPNVVIDESNVSSKTDSHQSSLVCLLTSKKKEKIVSTLNCEYLDTKNNKSSCNSVISHQLPTYPPCIIEEINTSNAKFSSCKSDKKDDLSIGNSNIKLHQPSPKILFNKAQTKFIPSNLYSDFMDSNNSNSSNSNDNLSSSLPVSVKDETISLQSDKYNVLNNKDFDFTITNCDPSSITSININKKSNFSLSTDYLSNTDTGVDNYNCSKNLINEYFQLSSEYCKNQSLIHLSPSCTTLEYNSSSDEEIDDIIDSLEKSCNQLPPELLKEEKETKSSNKYSHLMVDENSDDGFIGFGQLQSTEENSKHILLIDISDDNESDNIENDYYESSSESSDSEPTESIKSYEYCNVSSYESSPETSSEQSSVSSLDINLKYSLKDTYSDYMSDESSYDSSSSSDQLTESKNIFQKRVHKCSQTIFSSNHVNHKQCINCFSDVDESLTEKPDDTTNKCTQTNTDWPDICKDCCQVTIDIIDAIYPVPEIGAIKNSINSYSPCSFNTKISTNSVNSFTSVNTSSQKNGNSVDSFTPVNSSAQIVNNTIISASAEEYELTDNDDLDSYVSFNSQYSSSFQQCPWNPDNANDNFATRYDTINENNDCRLENDITHCSESHTVRSKQNENVLYKNIINGSIINIDKSHIRTKERLKETIDTVFGKHILLPNDYIEVKAKKNLKRRLGLQVADDKENHMKNNRWITEALRKKKRICLPVMRTFSCSDESDNNDNIDD